jgi:hypothetical protein
MAACKSYLENTRKMSLMPIFNKNLPRAHTESEFDVLGVHGKLFKYLVPHPKEKIEKKEFRTSCPNKNRPVLGLKEF